MKRLLFLPFMLLLTGCLGNLSYRVEEVVEDTIFEYRNCAPSRGKALRIIAQQPASDATDVSRNALIFVEYDDSEIGGARFGRFNAFYPDGTMPHVNYWDGPTGHSGRRVTLTPLGALRPNTRIDVEVEIDCFDVHRFSFETGS